MKVRMQLQGTNRGIIPGSIEAHYHCYVDDLASAKKLSALPFDTELPELAPEKSDGQKAFEAFRGEIGGRADWSGLDTETKNRWHKIAAAVTGKPPALTKTPGERLRAIAHPSWKYRSESSWSELADCEREIWEMYARRYEASK